MTTPNDTNDARNEVVYPTTAPAPLRTVDHRSPDRPDTPESRAILSNLVNETDDENNAIASDMPLPHLGPRFSQRQAARKLLAGRSYQAVQAWLRGEPVPAVTADWLEKDLQRIDNRADKRMVRVGEDEIAIVVKR